MGNQSSSRTKTLRESDVVDEDLELMVNFDTGEVHEDVKTRKLESVAEFKRRWFTTFLIEIIEGYEEKPTLQYPLSFYASKSIIHFGGEQLDDGLCWSDLDIEYGAVITINTMEALTFMKDEAAIVPA